MMNELAQYVIYDHPKDFPDKFVVRKWIIGSGVVTPQVGLFAQADTLEEARDALPFGLNQMPVFENDDPVIAEVWM